MYLVYCPFPNISEAKKAAKALVEDNLCCCVNVIKSYSSIYKEKGRLVEDSEFILIAKALDSTVEGLEKKLGEIHTYDVPAILRIKVDKTNKDYEKWCERIA